MTPQSFTLMPFPGGPHLPGLRLDGLISRQADVLHLRFRLHGALARVALPPLAAAPARRWLLWEETCFECFLAVPGDPGYWEVNLSPAGHWNVFRLTSYRFGMHEDPDFQDLKVAVLREAQALTLELDLPVETIAPPHQMLETGLSAVVKLTDGTRTYWALTHGSPEPDFHRRESFLLTL